MLAEISLKEASHGPSNLHLAPATRSPAPGRPLPPPAMLSPSPRSRSPAFTIRPRPRGGQSSHHQFSPAPRDPRQPFKPRLSPPQSRSHHSSVLRNSLITPPPASRNPAHSVPAPPPGTPAPPPPCPTAPAASAPGPAAPIPPSARRSAVPGQALQHQQLFLHLSLWLPKPRGLPGDRLRPRQSYEDRTVVTRTLLCSVCLHITSPRGSRHPQAQRPPSEAWCPVSPSSAPPQGKRIRAGSGVG